MADPSSITYRRMPLIKAGEVHRLFVAAVRTSFTYFDDAIQVRTIREHRPHRLFLAALNPRRLVITAWRDSELVGYAIGSVPRSGAGQLYWLYVAPSSRGNNTGLALLSNVLRRERQLGAHSVTLATHDHRRYYERQGFKCVETRMIDGVEMEIMRYQLS